MSADPHSSTTAPTESPRGLAARAAHWSAEHRKLAIWGWIAFVVVGVMVGNAIGQNQIHGADEFTGEAGDAEQALEDAGMRPNDELDANLQSTLQVIHKSGNLGALARVRSVWPGDLRQRKR